MAADFKLWLEFEEWSNSKTNTFDPEDEFINASVTLKDGRRYALNIWTYKNVAKQIADAASENNYLHGEYLTAPDLLVARIDRPFLERVFEDLIRFNRLKPE